MINIVAQLKSFRDRSQLSRSLRLVFWVFLFVLLALEGRVIKKVASAVLASHQEPVIPNKPIGVRVNFSNYEAVVKRIEDGRKYNPVVVPVRNTFLNKE